MNNPNDKFKGTSRSTDPGDVGAMRELLDRLKNAGGDNWSENLDESAAKLNEEFAVVKRPSKSV